MRPKRLFLAAAGGLIAFAAPAQQPAPSEAAEAARAAERGLSDLDDTVRQLDDAQAAPPPVESPAQTAPPPSPETPPTPSPAPPPAAPAGPVPPLTRAQLAEIDRIALRGRQLVAIAQAGSIATRDMLSRISDPEAAGIVGWIAEPAGNAITIIFYASGEGRPNMVYRGDVLGGRVTERQLHLAGDRPALSPLEARMAAARAATEALGNRPCTGDVFNFLVMPPPSASAPIDVYQIPPSTQLGRIPFGGHFRTSVAADGTVSGSRNLSPICRDVAVAAVPAGQEPEPVTVAAAVEDRMPTEIHVFLSALARRPLRVTTSDPQRTWLVTPDRIAEVRQ